MLLKKIKENLFLVLVIFTYLVMFIINPSIGLSSVKNSVYYIKEMLMIMPVIFILTALLDMWLPKEKIMQLLGKESKTKGVLFSFIIGSISAGPIYAAFPMCVMLHKKGAAIRNIIIILSSWAVIKIPMLLNEAKFLGIKFMVARWILTVIAIIIFSWAAAKMIRDEELPQNIVLQPGIYINKDACIGCTLCVKNYSDLFEMQEKKASVKCYEKNIFNKERLISTIKACPVRAIDYIE